MKFLLILSTLFSAAAEAAYFAKLDSQNTVLEVIVVSDQDAPTESAGVAFLTARSGYTNWKQCSVTGLTRKQYPGIGFTYDPITDKFVAPSPGFGWVLDVSKDWIPPYSAPVAASGVP